MTKSSVTILPATGPIRGEMTVPGDKSISHRAVMLGSIAEGDTTIKGFLDGADNRATIAAFRAMGVNIEERLEAGVKTLIVHGVGLRGLSKPLAEINAMNSGTTARLLTGLLSGQDFSSVITGDDSLRARPMGRVVKPLSLMGARIKGREESPSSGRKDTTFLPLNISSALLKGIHYDTPVASAQLKSSILLAGLYAEGETKVTEPAQSRDHTERMLKAMGAEIRADGLTTAIRGGAALKGIDIDVPGDISSAAFFMVAALIVPGSELLIKGVGVNATRTGIIHILRNMGAHIELKNIRGEDLEPTADILVKATELKGIDIDGTALLPAIDEFPIITVAAAFAKGTTKISGAGELRVKESDRIAAMASHLKGMGLSCMEEPEGINIDGARAGALRGCRCTCHGDHRIAMSLAIAALGAGDPLTIEDSHCVDVSYPGFFSTLQKVRGGKGQ